MNFNKTWIWPTAFVVDGFVQKSIEYRQRNVIIKRQVLNAIRRREENYDEKNTGKKFCSKKLKYFVLSILSRIKKSQSP